MKHLAFPLASILLSATAFAQDKADLIGGSPADPKDWPASVYASMNGSRCTATVVGERVLFIAAHCVSNGGKASFAVGPNQYTSTCTHSPNYRNDNTADWALCLVDRKVEGIPYERVNADAALVKVGDTLTLTGYGCVRQGGGGGNDGVYRVGEARVQSVPSSRTNDIVTRGGAALCYGDSGGPAFAYTDTGKTQRVLVSINSRGDISTTSYLSSVSTATAQSFIADWSARQNAAICGISEKASGCRGENNPPDESLPTECQSLGAAAFAQWQSCLTAATAPARAACENVQETMQVCFAARFP